MMIIGETIMMEVVSDTPNPTAVFTPWFPRQGDALTSTIQVIAMGGSAADLQADLYHKNSEDTGDGSVNGTGSVSVAGAGVGTFRNTGCKELVRYKITLDVEDQPSIDGLKYAHFRMLAPAWEATGAQSI